MSATKDLLRKYGEIGMVFDGLSYCAYMVGIDILSSVSGEDPLEDEAYEALLESLERKVRWFCALVEESKK